MGLPLGTIIDYCMEVTGAWLLNDSIMDYHLFGYVYIEQLHWLSLYAFFTISFYRVFGNTLEESAKTTSPLKLRYLAGWHGFLMVVFVIIWLVNPALLIINYFYLKAGMVIGVLPTIYCFIRYPTIWRRFVFPTIYFAYFALIYEIVSLHFTHWSFPAEEQFLFMINLGGHKFPFEELFFWILFGSTFSLAYYEVFIGREQEEQKN
jgi:hypothetical protein